MGRKYRLAIEELSQNTYVSHVLMLTLYRRTYGYSVVERQSMLPYNYVCISFLGPNRRIKKISKNAVERETAEKQQAEKHCVQIAAHTKN